MQILETKYFNTNQIQIQLYLFQVRDVRKNFPIETDDEAIMLNVKVKQELHIYIFFNSVSSVTYLHVVHFLHCSSRIILVLNLNNNFITF